MGSSSQKLPDPWETAGAQTLMQQKLNEQVTRMNRPDEVTPFGTTLWERPSKTNGHKWISTVTLPANMQQALNNQQKSQSYLSGLGVDRLDSVRSAMAQPLDTSSLQTWQAAPIADSALRDKVEKAYYDRQRSMLDPQFGQQEAQLRTRLAQQGLSPTSEAFNTDMGNFLRGKNNAYENAMNDAIINGGNQMQQQFQMGLQGAQFNNSLRDQQLQQLAFLRNLPLQETLQLLGANVGSPQFNGFSQAPASSAPDYTGLVGQNYASQLAAGSANNAMLGQLAGAGLNAAFSKTGSAALGNLWGGLQNAGYGIGNWAGSLV